MNTSRAIRLVIVAVAVLTSAVPPAIAAGRTHPPRAGVYATYYGWFDNTPPGCATAYSGCAGGTGTYANPITFASDRAEFPVGTVLYDSHFHKYLRMGDDCQECDLDWSGHGPDGGPRLHHIDVWVGGRGGNAFDAIDCEDALTRSRPDGAPLLTSFVVDPRRGLPVSAQPLFTARSGRCFGGARSQTTTGHYRNLSTGRCLADAAGRTPTPASTERCRRGRAQRVAYDGAFLEDRGRCLRTTGAIGRALDWTRCDGDAGEQWEINPNGTITWVQYTRCLADEGGRVVLAACSRGPAQRWSQSGD